MLENNSIATLVEVVEAPQPGAHQHVYILATEKQALLEAYTTDQLHIVHNNTNIHRQHQHYAHNQLNQAADYKKSNMG